MAGLNATKVFGQPLPLAIPVLADWALECQVGFEAEQLRIAMADALLQSLSDPLVGVNVTIDALCKTAARYVSSVVFAYLWLDVGPVAQAFPIAVRTQLEDSFRAVVNCAVAHVFDQDACTGRLAQAPEPDIAAYLQELLGRTAKNLEACACP